MGKQCTEWAQSVGIDQCPTGCTPSGVHGAVRGTASGVHGVRSGTVSVYGVEVYGGVYGLTALRHYVYTEA